MNLTGKALLPGVVLCGLLHGTKSFHHDIHIMQEYEGNTKVTSTQQNMMHMNFSSFSGPNQS